MTGIDTTWLVDLEVRESRRHEGARRLFELWRSTAGERLFVYHHVFSEFLHVVTDPKRFSAPLPMDKAVERVWFWASQDRVKLVFPDGDSFKRSLMWMSAWGLGRKRIVDAQMAAAYAQAGVSRLLTANPRDFAVFACFDLPEY